MGVDFRATALIGVELDKSKLYVNITERGCEHTEVDVNFCPECGKKMWNQWQQVMSEFTSADYEFEYFDTGKIVFKTVFLSFRLATTTDDDRVFLGVFVASTPSSSDNEAGLLQIPDIKAIKQDLKEYLLPLQLWDETKFGLWAISYVSY